MAAVTGVLGITYSQYFLMELNCGGPADDMYAGFNGLISAREYMAVIMTGTESGPVSVTADWQETQPPLDLDPWDDVVEVSMVFDEEPAVLYSVEGTGTLMPQLPPGSYRVRVHARGRDRARALLTVWDPPVEEHLIQAWPAPVEPEVRHKLTDQYGATIRAR
jgi:hypothetical protein